MKQLSEEQFEEIVAGRAELPAGVDETIIRRVRDHRALRERLRAATEHVRTPDSLRHAIHTKLIVAEARPIRGWLLRAAPLAATILLVATVGLLVWSGTRYAHGGSQARLASLHADVSEHFIPGGSADAINRQLREGAVSVSATLPKLGGGCVYRGSAIRRFRDRAVGCAVVTMDDRPVTIFIVPDEADSLGFDHLDTRGDVTWAWCSEDGCRMVAAEARGKTFIAVGELPHAKLKELLGQIVSG
jgi:hypothetical protein